MRSASAARAQRQIELDVERDVRCRSAPPRPPASALSSARIRATSCSSCDAQRAQRGCWSRALRAARRTASRRSSWHRARCPGTSPAELGFDRHDEAAVADGDDLILDRARVLGRTQQRRRAVARVVLRLRDAAAQAAQRRRGAVEHEPALVDRVDDPRDDRRAARETPRSARAAAERASLSRIVRAASAAGRQRVGDRAQLERRRRRAARRGGSAPSSTSAMRARAEVRRRARARASRRSRRPAGAPCAKSVRWVPAPARGRAPARHASGRRRARARARSPALRATAASASISVPRSSPARAVSTSTGLALPRLAFITWPTRNLSAFSLPALNRATLSALAASTPSTNPRDRGRIGDLREPFGRDDRLGRTAVRPQPRQHVFGDLRVDRLRIGQPHRARPTLPALP